MPQTLEVYPAASASSDALAPKDTCFLLNERPEGVRRGKKMKKEGEKEGNKGPFCPTESRLLLGCWGGLNMRNFCGS